MSDGAPPENVCLLITTTNAIVKNEFAFERHLFCAALHPTRRISRVLISRRSVCERERGEWCRSGTGLLMVEKLAEGERQRSPQPIERPQCDPSRMPSIPVCCVKVGPVQSNRGAFSHEGHLKHTQTKLETGLSDALRHPPTSTLFQCGEKV